jgi:mannose PTS system EIIA component
MTRLFIVAHQPLASAFGRVAQHTFPDCAATLGWLDVAPEASVEQVVAQIAKALAALGVDAAGDSVLILTDVQGATPANAAAQMAQGRPIRVLAGLNAAMLWRSLCYASQPLDELFALAEQGGHRGISEPVAAPSAC